MTDSETNDNYKRVEHLLFSTKSRFTCKCNFIGIFENMKVISVVFNLAIGYKKINISKLLIQQRVKYF